VIDTTGSAASRILFRARRRVLYVTPARWRDRSIRLDRRRRPTPLAQAPATRGTEGNFRVVAERPPRGVILDRRPATGRLNARHRELCHQALSQRRGPRCDFEWTPARNIRTSSTRRGRAWRASLWRANDLRTADIGALLLAGPRPKLKGPRSSCGVDRTTPRRRRAVRPGPGRAVDLTAGKVELVEKVISRPASPKDNRAVVWRPTAGRPPPISAGRHGHGNATRAGGDEPRVAVAHPAPHDDVLISSLLSRRIHSSTTSGDAAGHVSTRSCTARCSRRPGHDERLGVGRVRRRAAALHLARARRRVAARASTAFDYGDVTTGLTTRQTIRSAGWRWRPAQDIGKHSFGSPTLNRRRRSLSSSTIDDPNLADQDRHHSDGDRH